MRKYITTNSTETKELGKKIAENILIGLEKRRVFYLWGDLGSGKTTFSQGLLERLGAEGPYTSPTFAIMKVYNLQTKNHQLKTVYHIDAYRVEEKDILDLGWKDFAGKENSVTIVEWAERIENIISPDAVRINFRWLNENDREITFS